MLSIFELDFNKIELHVELNILYKYFATWIFLKI